MSLLDEYKKRQKENKQVTNNNLFYELKQRKAFETQKDIISRMNSWNNNSSAFMNEFKNRFYDKDGNYIDSFRSDTNDALIKANIQKKYLDTERESLSKILKEYESFYDENWVKNIRLQLANGHFGQDKIIESYVSNNNLFSQFENADEFDKWSEQQKKDEELRKTDLNYTKNQITVLELDFERMQNLRNKESELFSELSAKEYALKEQNRRADLTVDPKLKKEVETLRAELETTKAEYAQLSTTLGNADDIASRLNSLRDTYEQAKEFQETEALTTKALNAPDFKEFAQKGSEWGADTNFEIYGKDEGRGTYGFFNREKNDLISYYRNNLSSYENEAARMVNGPTKEMEKAYHFAKEMTEDEYNIYAYYLGKGDTGSAKKYLDSIEQSITYRFAENFYEQNLKDANIFEQIIFGLSVGTEQFQTGLENLISDETEYDSSYRQLISGKVQEDLKDSTFGKVAYDLSVTTGNMLPSILASTAIGLINPVAGNTVGTALMGASAKGNAYAEMINLGYTKEQASNYSTLVGASEAGLQYLLGGIGKLGGSVSSKAISSAVSKIDNVFARTAIQLGGSMLSEGAEEYLQEVLDPFFKNIAFGEDNDIRFISEEALYSGLLGALSAGVLEGGSVVSSNINTYKTGKQIKAAGVTAEQLSELGSKLSVDSEAYKLAGRINENTGAYTIGRMFNELNAEITVQNKAEIKEALRAKGINPVSANSIANWMERVVAGEELTSKQKAALENNPVLGEVMRDVLYERNTTALQRQAGLDSIRSQLEEYQIKQALDKAVKKAEKKKAKNTANNTADTQDVQNTAQQAEMEDFETEADTSLAESEKANEANPRVSDNGRTFSTKTGEDLDIVGIASTKDKTFKTADGQTVDSKDVSFATENEAVLFDSVLSMDLPTEIANAIIDGYIPSNNISVTDYLLGSNLAYRYGYAGAKDIELMLDTDVRNIPEHLSKGLYNLGRETAKAEISKEQAEIDSKKAQKSENKAKKKGRVTFDGKELSKEFEDSLTDIQRESLKGIKVIAEVLGNDVNLFASYIAKEGAYKGKRVYKDSNGNVKLAPNGFYNPDGSINLDINSGNLGEGTMLYTLSHELTHHIRKWSPAKFKVLADFVVEQYSDNGIKINDLVYEQMAKAKKNGKSISYGTAYEEVIADACSTMLLDSNAIEKLAQKDKTLFEKIKSFIKDFIDKINKLYKNFSPDAKEAQYVKDIKGMTDKLQALWFEGLEDASEANLTSVETTKTKYQLREYSKHQKENWKNSKKIVLYENVIQFEAFINEARTNNQFVKKMYFGSIPNDLAKLIKQKTGINVENYNCSLGANEIRKIFKDHGDEDFESLRGQRAITIADIKNIPVVIQSPDDIVLSETPYNGKPVIRFVKDINGKITISAVVSDKHLDLFVQTAYASAKKRSLATATDEQAPVNTPEATRSTAPNIGSLPQNSESSQGKFSLRESVEETKDLVAVHNISEEKLLKSLQLGGLPMPSIAIIRAKEGHENFGTISLVFGKETIDPQFFRSNKVYSGDAWTPTYPRVEYKIDENVVEKGVDEVERLIKSRGFGKDDFGYLSSISEDSFKYGNTEEVANKTALQVAYLIDKGIDFKPVYKEGQLSDFGRFDNFVVKNIAEALGKERIVELHNNSEGVKSAVEEIRNLANEYKANKYKDNEKLFAELSKNPFYGENNFGFSQAHEIVEGAYKYFNNGSRTKIDEWETKNEIADLIDKTDYKKWVNNLFDGFVAKEGIRNNKDLFTPSGNRRSFEDLHYEHNLENVIKAMKEEGSKGVGSFGGGNIFGASTTEISSIADVKNSAKKRLQSLSDEEFSEIKKGFADRFFELASSLPNNKDSFTATDDAANVLVEAISKYKTKSGIANYIRRECQGWATYSDYVVDDLIELVSDIQQMPTKYFEAKPQRAVGFDEVKAVIIPDNSSAELKSALKSKSFNVLEYQSGNEQDRVAVLNSIEDVKFSDRDSDGNTLSKEQQEFFKDSKVRDKDGNLLVVYHGTRKADFTVFKRNINFFTDDKEMADSYAYNSEMYTGYLNIVNPYIIDAKGEKWSRIPIDAETKNMLAEYGASTFKEGGKWRTTPADIAYAIEDGVDNGDFDYDGIIIRNINDTGSYYKSNDNIIADDYITFNSNQFKNIDNKTPTSDPDIHFSDRDSVDSLLERRTSIQSKLDELRKTRKELESSDEFNNLISDILSAEKETEKTKSINEYNSWTAKTKYDEIVDEIESLQKEYSEINRTISERVKQKAIEDERKKIAESGLSDADYFRKSAIKEFGYTPYFYDAGYMLPNGKLLNFSGEKGKHFGSRGQDHRAIETVYADVSRGKAMLKFMSEGNIRVMAETPGLDISSVAEPTSEQYTVIKKFVREYAKEKYLAVDITDENGNVIGTYGYENNINADRVVNDIKYYFQNGAIREQSSVSKFFYSDRDPDSFEARQEVQKQLVKENAILKEDNILLKELVALQRKVTNGTILKKSSVEAVSKKIMKQLNVKGNTQELSKLLSDVYSYILRGTEVTWEDITEKAQPAINWIYENMQTEKVVDEYTLGVLREIRKSRVSLDETQKAEIKAVLGSYKDFQKYTFGKIIIAKDGLSMDSWWGEMNEKYPNIFDIDISSSDMPTALIGILDNLSNSLYEEVYNYQSEMTKQDVLTEIYDGYWDVSTLHTVADQNQKKINELKAKHKEKMSKVRSSHNKKIVELKNKHKQEIKEIKAALREKSLQKEKDIRTKYQESRKNAIDKRHQTQMRHKIQKVIMELDGMLRHGTKEKNVKVGLQKVVADAVQAINADTVKLEALRKAYADIRYGKSEDVPAYYMEEAAQIEQKIDEVIDLVGDTPMSKMSLEQLNSVYDMYRMVLTTVRNVNKVFRENKLEDLRVNAEAVMVEESRLPKLKEERSKAIETVRKYMWNEMIPVYAFETLGSNTLKKFFWDTVEAQNVFAKDVDEANAVAKNAREKYGYKTWDRSKIYEFTLEDGKVMRMNLEHMMSVYAYSKRKQAISHMTTGGFFFNDDATFRKKGGVISLISSQEEGYKVSAETLAKIKDKMSEVAKGSIEYVDEMQSYLTDMGEKGNEVSRVIWGIDIFKEKVYFPLKSVKDFVFQTNQPTQETSLKNDGMTKETKPNASNPIVLDSFDDIWASHVNRMSQYHAFVIPIDNLNKVYNYGTWLGDSSKSVSTIIGSRHGKAANEYLTQFIQDLNGGISVKGASNPLMNMFGKFKKTAVAASTSVVVQQPTAILRATAMIAPKYFAGKPNVKQYKQLKKYAPIAIIKEIGGFDAGAGRQATNWLNDDTKQGVDKALQKIDDISMLGAAGGDILGWCTIWAAVKREVKANNKGMDVNSEEFLNLAGKRFTEVIVYTQVYDSTLSRSGYMRSKHDSVKMLTAFMGEPTVSVNMMYNAVLQAKRGGKGMIAKAARTIVAVYLSQIAASAAASAIYALRDDDEDETFGEKFAEAWSDKMLGKYALTGELNPLTQLPAVKDIISIFEGWDVERTDIAVIKDIKDAFDGLFSDNKSTWRKIEDFSGAIASLFGLPVKNVIRTGREIYNAFKMGFSDVEGGSFGEAFVRGMTGEEKSKPNKLYDAIVNGDEEMLKMLREGYDDDTAYETAVKKALRENDPRVKEAAKAGYNGDVTERVRIAKEIIAEGNFSQDIVVEAINAEVNFVSNKIKEAAKAESKGDRDEKKDIIEELINEHNFSEKDIVNAIKKELDSEEDEAEDVEEKKSIYSTKDISTALEDGDAALAKEIIADIVSVKVENYMAKDEDLKQKEAEKKAKTSVKSSLSEYWKKLYVEAYNAKDTDEMKRIRFVLKDTGLYGTANDIISTCNNWVKESRKK